MQLYLAGKVEGRKWAVVKDRTSVTWVSSDGSNHSEHLWGGGYHPLERIGNPDLRSTVASELLGKLRTSQGLVAYLDTPDSYGSIVEIATMSALNKPCFLVILAPIWTLLSLQTTQTTMQSGARRNKWPMPTGLCLPCHRFGR